MTENDENKNIILNMCGFKRIDRINRLVKNHRLNSMRYSN